MSSPPFPSTVPSHDIPFPPQGLLGVGFPCFNGTMECSDSRSFVPTRFVSFACRYHPRSCTSLPPMTRATSKGRGLLLFASLSPRRLFSDGNDRASQVPGEPLWACPVLKTPAGPSRQALAARRCGLPLLVQRRLPPFRFFRGSMARPAHPLSTLRRTDHSATTQDSLPAVGHTLPDRMLPPAGSLRKVSTMSHNIASPFPKLS